MGVTNYHTINGRIVGQTKNGVRTHYVPDALGSVVATLDANGTVENTYRYKPYGSLLAKTGTGEDPKFMWIGTKSVRQVSSAAVWSPKLRVAIDTATANFLTPIGLGKHAVTLHRGAKCRPKMRTVLVAQGWCGDGFVRWQIEFDKGCSPPLESGWVVQQIRRTGVIYDCQPPNQLSSGYMLVINELQNPFWEGWQVAADGRGQTQAWMTSKDRVPEGTIQPGNAASDIFSIQTPRGYRNTRGVITIEGRFGYYSGLPEWTSEVIRPWAEDMPTSVPVPISLRDALPIMGGSAHHSATFKWNCCNSNVSTQGTSITFNPPVGQAVYGA